MGPYSLAHQVPPFMGILWQEYWSGLPFPPPGDLPDPRIEHTSFMSPALTGKFFTTSATLESQVRRLDTQYYFTNSLFIIIDDLSRECLTIDLTREYKKVTIANQQYQEIPLDERKPCGMGSNRERM